MKKYSFLVTFLVICTTYAQSYKGMLSDLETDGLYKMVIPTKVRTASNDNFNSLRIVDNNKQEVPYVLLHATDKKFSNFVSKKIISKKRYKKSKTSIIIDNKEGLNQQEITLKIANTKIDKRYNVFGSNNNKDWFGLVSDESLEYASSTTKTVIEKTITFPLNDYKFLKIDFNDKWSLPINVLEAGVYKSQVFKQEPIIIDNFKVDILNIKERKVTQLKFKAPSAHKIDIVSFKVNTEFFLRKTKVILKRTRKIKKRTEDYEQIIDAFTLNSKNKNTFYLHNLNEKEFIIEIENEDNPPLTIESVQLFQKPICIVANLKQKESYELQLDTLLKKPSYDLGNFISNKTGNIKDIVLSDFSKIKIEKQNVNEEKSFWQTNAFMWICILLGGLLVVYFALSLLKDIDKENQ